MFYKALGMVIWKLATAELRRRYARQAKVGAALMVVSLVAVGYMAKRSTATE
jgi:hypothetical protein